MPVEIVGVDPADAPRTFRYVQHVHEGRYLRPGESGALVVGKAVADRLSDQVVHERVRPAVLVHQP